MCFSLAGAGVVLFPPNAPNNPEAVDLVREWIGGLVASGLLAGAGVSLLPLDVSGAGVAGFWPNILVVGVAPVVAGLGGKPNSPPVEGAAVVAGAVPAVLVVVVVLG